jgi:predicted transcriptional regulator
MKTVKDIMTKSVVTTGLEASVHEVSKLMAEKHIGSVAVMEDDKLTGIVTERDITHKVVGGGMDIEKTRVKDVMHAQLTTAGPLTSVNEASNILMEGGFRRLPIMEDGKLIGIVTETDIEIALRQEALEETQARMRDHYKFAEQIRQQERKIEDLRKKLIEFEKRMKG